MKICFFGDSFTKGIGDDTGLGWVGRVCDVARSEGNVIQDYNFGVQGDTSADIIERWQEEAEQSLPDGQAGAVVFAFGTNDCAKGDDRRARLPQDERLRNVKAILTIATQKWPTLLIGPLPIADDAVANKRIADMSRHMGVLAKVRKVPYLDVFSTIQESDIWKNEALANDGAHPNSGGYTLVANLVSAWPAWQDLVSD